MRWATAGVVSHERSRRWASLYTCPYRERGKRRHFVGKGTSMIEASVRSIHRRVGDFEVNSGAYDHDWRKTGTPTCMGDGIDEMVWPDLFLSCHPSVAIERKLIAFNKIVVFFLRCSLPIREE